MNDHELTQLANDLRDIVLHHMWNCGTRFNEQDAQKLRQKINQRLAPEIAKLRAVRPIRTDAEHKAAMARIEQLMPSDPAPGTPDGDELELLATLVEAYETKRYMTCTLKMEDKG